ncbi:MAG: outer membrane chaperone Skp [Cereibacter sphaeroides]|uniref:Outer membrane chaperone Skp n=1 Tax=Cereibacter sphaeroides TaxID=1063 RepID=A0A2W5SFD2_CERSP|nr:MAG: outer membrane chaperone Skp [Cereibacter sphaeroides]
MRIAAHVIAAAMGLALAGQSSAQVSLGEPVVDEPQGGIILMLDQDRLYRDSRFGQRMLGEIDAKLKQLQVENRRIEADLEAEEKSLTERRAALSAAEFHQLAQAFDTKVKGIRDARDAKSRDLAAQRDASQKTFVKTAVPILAEIMREKGAVAIVDRSAIILSFDRIDITDLAISRVDAELMPAGPGDIPSEAVPQHPTSPPAEAQPASPDTQP